MALSASFPPSSAFNPFAVCSILELTPLKALNLLNELNKVEGDIVDLLTLKKANIISEKYQYAKIILSKEPKLEKAVTVRGLRVTKGAQQAIEAAGGKVVVEE